MAKRKPYSEEFKREAVRLLVTRGERPVAEVAITRALRKRNVQVSRKHVTRLMRADGLVARPKKRFRVTTQSDHDHLIALADVLESSTSLSFETSRTVFDLAETRMARFAP